MKCINLARFSHFVSLLIGSVVAFTVTACSNALPPTLDTRWATNQNPIQRSPQTAADTFALGAYSLGLLSLKNMIAIMNVAEPGGPTRLPSCALPNSTRTNNGMNYSIDASKCAAEEQWNPQNINVTLDSRGNIARLAYNSPADPAAAGISMTQTGSSQNGAQSKTSTLSISGETISLKNQNGVYSFKYTGTIDFKISRQQNNSSGQQSNSSNNIDHHATVTIQGQLKRDLNQLKSQQIELQAFTVQYQEFVGPSSRPALDTSISLLESQNGFAPLSDSIPVATLAFTQTISPPANSSQKPVQAKVIIDSTATSVSTKDSGHTSLNLQLGQAASNDRLLDMFLTAKQAISQIQF